MKNHTIVATCAAGLEALLVAEARSAGGFDIVETTGAVRFNAELASAYFLCLWSRCASRVLLQLGSFTVTDERSLYTHIFQFPWEEHLDIYTTFAVDAALGQKAVFQHSHYLELTVKDAIVDRFREKTGSRPSVKTSRPGIRINIYVEENQAVLSLDFSGESLHRRGYRVAGSKAPLKETLAAAIVLFCGWGKGGEFAEALVDPMCGTGTLLIEAAMMAGDSAPGLSRTYFGFTGWKQHEPAVWDRLVGDAIVREEKGNERVWPCILGYDSDPHAVSAARKNIEHAGLADRIQINQAELARLRPPRAKGLILSNLPYGERLSDSESVTYLYRAFGRIALERFPLWRVGVFVSNPELTDSFMLAWQKRIKLMNGPIPCRVLVTDVPADGTTPQFKWEIQEINPDDGDFAHRLRKNLKQRFSWAAREGISCFRVYDRDLPEYNFSIDLYGKWILIQEYAPPKEISIEKAQTRFQAAVKTVQSVLGVRSDRVFLRIRQRQKGKSQYQQTASKKKLFEVQEGSCRFLVNLTDYLDTGLFLDHRPLRMRIFTEAQGKRFLNLFAYTGTASVHAAAGGAASTTTVDLSDTYLQWAKMNFSLNGFDTFFNHIIKADCMQWLREDTGTYDLIFVDPPTFSNTKKEKRVFDVQRDHVQLVSLVMKRLADGGVVYFSTNFRDFQLDSSLREHYLVKDIQQATIPHDFSRNSRIHACWQLMRKDD